MHACIHTHTLVTLAEKVMTRRDVLCPILCKTSCTYTYIRALKKPINTLASSPEKATIGWDVWCLLLCEISLGWMWWNLRVSQGAELREKCETSNQKLFSMHAGHIPTARCTWHVRKLRWSECICKVLSICFGIDENRTISAQPACQSGHVCGQYRADILCLVYTRMPLVWNPHMIDAACRLCIPYLWTPHSW